MFVSGAPFSTTKHACRQACFLFGQGNSNPWLTRFERRQQTLRTLFRRFTEWRQKFRTANITPLNPAVPSHYAAKRRAPYESPKLHQKTHCLVGFFFAGCTFVLGFRHQNRTESWSNTYHKKPLSPSGWRGCGVSIAVLRSNSILRRAPSTSLTHLTAILPFVVLIVSLPEE